MLIVFIMGFGIDIWFFLLESWVFFEIWYSKLCCYGIGLIIIGVGIFVYLYINFVFILIDCLILII